MTTSTAAFDLGVGSQVRMIARPAWGPGVVVALDADYFHVIFRDDTPDGVASVLRRSRRFGHDQRNRFDLHSPEDTLLAHFPTAVKDGADYILPDPILTLAAARAKYLGFFPGGFDDERNNRQGPGGERASKMAAHRQFVELLGGGQLEALLEQGRVAEIASRASSVLEATQVFTHQTTVVAFPAALEDVDGSVHYFPALSRLLRAPEIDEAVFADYLRGFFALRQQGAGAVHDWKCCLALPFLAEPQRVPFLTPSKTPLSAQRLGFDLKYQARPNWVTYNRLVRFSRWLRAHLADLGCRDFIDVQSFVWVTSGGYDQKPKKSPKGKADDDL